MSGEFNADEILREFDDGNVISYTCNLANGNDFPKEEAPYYYELLAPTVSVEAATYQIEENLLTDLAIFYDIFPDTDGNGSGCSRAPIFYGESHAWIAGLSSRPQDIVSTQFACSNLTPREGESCVVIEGKMTFTVNSPGEENEFETKILDRLNSGILTQGTAYQTKYIGSFLEPVEEPGIKTEAPVNPGTEPPPSFNGIRGDNPAPKESNSITAFGGALMGAMIVGFATILTIIIRRRRKRQMEEDLASAMRKSTSGGSGSEMTPRNLTADMEISVLSDSMLRAQSVNQSVLSDSVYTYESHEDIESNTYQSSYAKSYKFDLGSDWRDEILGIHPTGPTSMAVVPPYPMEETSQSEVDSWAQSQGTVGSLNNLEEAEI